MRETGLARRVSRSCCGLIKMRAISWAGPSSKTPRAINRLQNAPARPSVPTSCWSRSAKGASASSSWPSRLQPVRRKVALKVLKPGMDTPPGRGPLRGRAAGAGDHGPSPYRQGLGRRRHRIGPAVFRHGAGAGRAHHRVLRPEPLDATAAAGALHPRLPGHPARASEGHHPPRPEAVQRARLAARHHAGGQGDRFWRGQGTRAGADGQDALHRHRPDDRDAAVHVARNKPA